MDISNDACSSLRTWCLVALSMSINSPEESHCKGKVSLLVFQCIKVHKILVSDMWIRNASSNYQSKCVVQYTDYITACVSQFNIKGRKIEIPSLVQPDDIW